jgi:uncharacterized membrane protein
MANHSLITTNRLEAFSDGVIAIIITIMVFDLKFQNVPTAENLGAEARLLLPKFLSYALSFLVLAIMWGNHHQLLHQIKHTDRKLLWLNIHLLFWMSLIPFVTSFIGASPLLPHASAAYGLVFSFAALGFLLLRNYANRAQLMHETLNQQSKRRAQHKNYLGVSLYVVAAFAAFVSVYISFACFLIVPAMYFIPEKITHEEKR